MRSRAQGRGESEGQDAPEDVLLEIGLEVESTNLLDDASKPVDRRSINPSRSGLVEEWHLVEAFLHERKASARRSGKRTERRKGRGRRTGVASSAKEESKEEEDAQRQSTESEGSKRENAGRTGVRRRLDTEVLRQLQRRLEVVEEVDGA